MDETTSRSAHSPHRKSSGDYHDVEAKRPYHGRRRSRAQYDVGKPHRRDRLLRRLILTLFAVAMFWTLLRRSVRTVSEEERKYQPPQGASHAQDANKPGVMQDHPHGVFANYTKIPLETHIMSICPDTRRCMSTLVVPAMEQINEKVDFKLSFIGKDTPNSDAVECKHGPSECLGNMIMLCAAHLYPSPILSLGFANCLVADYKRIPERDLIEQCALEHGLNFDKINECISDDSGEGVELLRASVDRSRAANVDTSCTVRVSGKQWCVVDDGKWHGCKQGKSGVDALVAEIEAQWDRANKESTSV